MLGVELWEHSAPELAHRRVLLLGELLLRLPRRHQLGRERAVVQRLRPQLAHALTLRRGRRRNAGRWRFCHRRRRRRRRLWRPDVGRRRRGQRGGRLRGDGSARREARRPGRVDLQARARRLQRDGVRRRRLHGGLHGGGRPRLRRVRRLRRERDRVGGRRLGRLRGRASHAAAVEVGCLRRERARERVVHLELRGSQNCGRPPGCRALAEASPGTSRSAWRSSVVSSRPGRSRASTKGRGASGVGAFARRCSRSWSSTRAEKA